MALTEDTTRIMSRLKALYRGLAISCAGKKLYTVRHRGEWLKQLTQAGILRRAGKLYQGVDAVQKVRPQGRGEVLGERRKQPGWEQLRNIPFLGSNCLDVTDAK